MPIEKRRTLMRRADTDNRENVMQSAFENPSESDRGVIERFGQVYELSGGAGQVGHVCSRWEHLPRFVVTSGRAATLCSPDRLSARAFKHEYAMDGVTCKIVLEPAAIERKDGKREFVFPSVTEELVEEVLKSLLHDQRFGAFSSNSEAPESYVRFSVRLIEKELERHGRRRSNTEICRALQVLNRAHLSYYEDGVAIHQGPIIGSLTKLSREASKIQDRITFHAQLPPLMSRALQLMDYRQFNLSRLFAYNTMLGRALYKQMVIGYRQAHPTQEFEFLFSSVYATGLLSCSTDRDNRKKVIAALKESVKLGVIGKAFEEQRIMDGRRTIDVRYKVRSTKQFMSEQKAANARCRDQAVPADRIGTRRRGYGARPAGASGYVLSNENFSLKSR